MQDACKNYIEIDHQNNDLKVPLSTIETQVQSSKLLTTSSLKISKQHFSIFTTEILKSDNQVSKNEVRQIEFSKFRFFLVQISFHLTLFYLLLSFLSIAGLTCFYYQTPLVPQILFAFIFYQFFETIFSIYFLFQKTNKNRQNIIRIICALNSFSALLSFSAFSLFLNQIIDLSLLLIFLAITVAFSLFYFLFVIFGKPTHIFLAFLSFYFSLTLFFIAFNSQTSNSFFGQICVRYFYRTFIFMAFFYIFVTLFFISGLGLFINLKLVGLNRKLKNWILFFTGFIISISLWFTIKFIKIVQPFGDFSLFLQTTYQPWIRPEQVITFLACLLFCMTLFLFTVICLFNFKEPLKNILFRMVYDIEGFCDFLISKTGSFFGILEQKERKEYLKGKLSEIKLVLKPENCCLKICIVCGETGVNILFDPCKHAMLCSECFGQLLPVIKKCPGCQKNIKFAALIRFDKNKKKFQLEKTIEVKK